MAAANGGDDDEVLVGPGGLTGEDSDRDIFSQMQLESLVPIKEDLARWMNDLLGISISANEFLDPLDNGVAFCNLANMVQTKATELKCQPDKTKLIKCKANATSGSWFARDNCANFLRWCRGWGIKTECLFESEDLVNHKQEPMIVSCLLEIARMCGRVGLPVPALISLEKEIEEEVEEPQVKPEVATPSSSATPSRKSKKGPKGPSLDDEVQKVAAECTCPIRFPIKRLREGTYLIGGKRVFIRLLLDRHLMVRVGGGWVELKAYLRRHDPCRVTRHGRRNGSVSDAAGGDAFLHIRGRYHNKTPAKGHHAFG